MSPQMRIKGPILLMICILVTSIFYCLIGDPKPSLQNIVSETHRQLSQPLKRLKDAVVPAVADSSNYYLGNDREPDSQLSDKYLRALGFVDSPRLFPSDVWHNVTLPVFVSAIKSGEANLAAGFVKSLQDHLPEYNLVLYDLGLDQDEITLINKVCNISTTCVIRKFAFEDFPSHVSDLKLSSFRPIILQQVLDQAGAVVWLDLQQYVTVGAGNKIKPVIDEAQKIGVMSWTIAKPTTSMTHPKMFIFFHTLQKKYYFHRMVEPSSLILFNTKRVHEDLMLPWVKCALISECIAPIGAQSSGCRFDKKPFFRYSGCHFYDKSALNVVLGLMFNFDEKQPYASDKEKFFQHISFEEQVVDIQDTAATGLVIKLKPESTTNESATSPRLQFNKVGWRYRE